MRLEAAQFDGCLLNTQQRRKAFCSAYKDELYTLASELTHDKTRAYALVLETFRSALERYANRPCSRDCMPYLSATLCLIFSQGGPAKTTIQRTIQQGARGTSTAQDSAGKEASQPTGGQEAKTGSWSAPRYARHAAPEPAPEPVKASPSAAAPTAQSAAASAGQPAAASSPGHAAYAAQTESAAQPISHQVFDPENTDYWTPDMDDELLASMEPTPAAAAATAQTAAPATAPVRPAAGENPVPAAAPVQSFAPESPAPANGPASAAQAEQPSTSKAYMYNADVAKKRKVIPLSILNTLLFLLLLWMAVGLLSRMDILPQWNLGYTWFNLHFFPLF